MLWASGCLGVWRSAFSLYSPSPLLVLTSSNSCLGANATADPPPGDMPCMHWDLEERVCGGLHRHVIVDCCYSVKQARRLAGCRPRCWLSLTSLPSRVRGSLAVRLLASYACKQAPAAASARLFWAHGARVHARALLLCHAPFFERAHALPKPFPRHFTSGSCAVSSLSPHVP